MHRSFLFGAAFGALSMGLSACAATPVYPSGGDPPSSPASAATRAPAPATGAALAQSSPGQSSPAQSSPAQTSTLPGATPSPQTGAAPAPSPPPGPSSAAVESSALPAVPETSAPPPAATPPGSFRAPKAPPPPLASPAPPTYRPETTKRLATGDVVHPKGMYRLYTVAAHDDLDAIARDLNASPEEIIKANRLKHPNALTVGQHLKIPVAQAYVARSGDTLSVIARRFAVSVGDLADINDLSERARLRSGEEIALPADAHDRGPITEEVSRRSVYAPSGGVVANGEPYTPSPYALEEGRLARERAQEGSGAATPAPSTMASVSASPTLSDSQVTALAHGRFIWPVQGSVANKFGVSGLGVRNDGIDVSAPLGAPVHAAAAGDVVYAGNQIPGFGNLVLIEHADGWVTAYAHLQHMSVRMRQFVSQGEEIGTVGDTGGLTSPQLHFEIRHKANAGEKAKPIDPMLALPAQEPTNPATPQSGR